MASLRHRSEQGQAAGRRGHRLVRDAHRLALDQIRGLLRVRSEVEVGEQNLPLAQHGALAGQRFLDLDDHLRPLEDHLRALRDGRAHLGVLGIIDADARPGAVLHNHVVAMQDHLVHAVRRESHAVLVILDFFWNPDEHRDGLLFCETSGESPAPRPCRRAPSFSSRLPAHGLRGDGGEERRSARVVSPTVAGRARLHRFARNGGQTCPMERERLDIRVDLPADEGWFGRPPPPCLSSRSVPSPPETLATGRPQLRRAMCLETSAPFSIGAIACALAEQADTVRARHPRCLP